MNERVSGRIRMMSIALAACALVLALQHGKAEGARLSDQEITSHLSQGEQAFRRAMELDRSDPEAARAYYQEAILHYEALRKDGGVRNGKLFYDIGNAYFRLGDTGRAILNYKRAALFMQNDQNLRQNLEYARSRRADRIETREKDKVLKTLLFIHYDVPPRTRLYIFAISFGLLWASAAVRLFLKMGWLKVPLYVAAVVSCVFLASLIADSVGYARTPEGVITADEAVGRMGDAETYQESFKEPLHSGVEFRLLEKRPGWWHIELESGDRTWIPEGSGELVF